MATKATKRTAYDLYAIAAECGISKSGLNWALMDAADDAGTLFTAAREALVCKQPNASQLKKFFAARQQIANAAALERLDFGF